jgi:hypothetical protein
VNYQQIDVLRIRDKYRDQKAPDLGLGFAALNLQRISVFLTQKSEDPIPSRIPDPRYGGEKAPEPDPQLVN